MSHGGADRVYELGIANGGRERHGRALGRPGAKKPTEVCDLAVKVVGVVRRLDDLVGTARPVDDGALRSMRALDGDAAPLAGNQARAVVLRGVARPSDGCLDASREQKLRAAGPVHTAAGHFFPTREGGYTRRRATRQLLDPAHGIAAQVVQGAAAHRIDKVAEAALAVVDELRAIDSANPPQLTGAKKGLHTGVERNEPALHRLDEKHAGFTCNGRDLAGLVGREHRRLLAEHGLSSVQGKGCPTRVHRVRERQVDGVDLEVGEQLLVCRRAIGAVSVDARRREGRQPLGRSPGHRDELSARDPRKARGEPLCDAARAEDSPANRPLNRHGNLPSSLLFAKIAHGVAARHRTRFR